MDYRFLVATIIVISIELLLFCFAAIGAALGFISETLFFVEILFAFGEYEFF